MRRKKDDKRVLRAGNAGQPSRSKQKRKRRRNQPAKNKKKRSGMFVFIVIMALVAFVIGAGIGISLSFDDGSDDANATHIKNVTEEMTTNLNETTPVTFDESVDGVDFNENQTDPLLGDEYNPEGY